MEALIKGLVEDGGVRPETRDAIIELKALCKSDSANERIAWSCLFKYLNATNSVSRFFALQVVGELFELSHSFRMLLLDDFQQFACRAAGIMDGKLPKPEHYAAKCRELALALFGRWQGKYGFMYKQLDVGYHYMNKHLKIFDVDDKPDPAENKKNALITRIYLADMKDMDDTSGDILENLQRMQSCFEMLIPGFEDSRERAPVDSGDWDLLRSVKAGHEVTVSLLLTGDGAGIINENADNKVIYDALRECLKLAVSKYRPALVKWVRSASRADVPPYYKDARVQTQNLRRITELKTFNEAAISRADTIIKLSHARAEADDDEFDDEEFEEVDVRPSKKAKGKEPATAEDPGGGEAIPACGARLRNGKLCPRRDLKRCPLHGPIIPRDEQGDPLDRSLVKEFGWKDLADDVAAAVGLPAEKKKRKGRSFLSEQLEAFTKKKKRK
ncbi:hypothetical protein HK101_010468 [Irineochytrium annulatum]|nr:hypothetical protein HK101_010468 [Irineochytrium annulatum]